MLKRVGIHCNAFLKGSVFSPLSTRMCSKEWEEAIHPGSNSGEAHSYSSPCHHENCVAMRAYELSHRPQSGEYSYDTWACQSGIVTVICAYGITLLLGCILLTSQPGAMLMLRFHMYSWKIIHGNGCDPANWFHPYIKRECYIFFRLWLVPLALLNTMYDLLCSRRIAYQEETSTFAVVCSRVDTLEDGKYLPKRQR